MSTLPTSLMRHLSLLLLALILAACGAAPQAAPSPQPTQPAPATKVSEKPTPAPSPTTLPQSTATAPAPTAPATSASVSAPGEELTAKIEAVLAQPVHGSDFMGSVLVAKDGSVLLSKGYGMADVEKKIPNTPQTRFRIASLTKQFTAVAILMLQEQGKLKVTDSVCKYIPDCPESWQPITIHHLLTHTAGLYDFRFSYIVIKEKASAAPATPTQLVARIKERPPSFKPGDRWSYSNGNYIVAGYIVEQVSGMSYEQFLQDHIFGPLGMKNSGYAHDDSGLAVGYLYPPVAASPIDGSLPYAAGGLYSSVEDLYTYSQALGSGRLLSKESLDALFGEHVRTDSVASETYPVPLYYGYGWGVAKYNGHRIVGHSGLFDGYASDLRMFPDDKLTLVVLQNRQVPNSETVTDEIIKRLFEAK